jgi:hypothetical protein
MMPKPAFRLWRNVYGTIAIAEGDSPTPRHVITPQEARDLILALEQVVDADGSKNRPYFSVPRDKGRGGASR